MATDDFASYCCELLGSVGPCTARKMFGGYGIRCAEFPIGLIVDQRLFLKVDDQTKPAFREAGCEPFVYGEKGKPMEMSYWSAPEVAMDSPGLMRPWAMLALQAAMRSKVKQPKARKAKPV